MTKITEQQVFENLQAVIDPQSGADIVSAGMVSGLQITDAGEIVFLITIDPNRGTEMEPLRQKAEKVVSDIDGVIKVSAVLTAEYKSQIPSPPKRPVNPHPTPSHVDLPHIKKVIAVASGKGGVGKSTVSINLAVALAKKGLRVGLLDADIYGPSQPRMAGLSGEKPELDKDERIIPLEFHGVKLMSIGFMVAEEKAMIWRGPMVQSALVQLLRDVAWGNKKEPLDILLIDMPPGTGDAQLTMAQKIDLSSAIIVSTPQDIALLDVRKGIQMFETVDVPVLGIVENMSSFICPSCGHEEHIFGHGGAEKEAKLRNVPFLGAVPLNLDIRLQSDAGDPVVVALPNSEGAKAFKAIAEKIFKF